MSESWEDEFHRQKFWKEEGEADYDAIKKYVKERLAQQRDRILDEFKINKVSCDSCDGSVVRDCGCDRANKILRKLEALKERIRSQHD